MNTKDVVVIALCITLSVITSFLISAKTQPTTHQNLVLNTTSLSPSLNQSYQNLYDEYIDSVVSIKTIKPTGTGQGTGFIYDEDGHIVTNHHVIQGATAVEVRFSNGEWRQATVKGTDIYSDLAVLHVPRPPTARPLPVSSDNPEPGTRVVALGNPFGLEGTLTTGVVSGVNRSMETAGGFTIPDTIQTDAPINPGNSGGPLLTLNGVVVGVNRAKQGDNIGFAISPAIVNRVIPALINDGVYYHPYLGISMQDMSPRLAEVNDLQRDDGVLVTDIAPNSPAMNVLQDSEFTAITQTKAFPLGGDVIIGIDNKTITTSQELTSYLVKHTAPGQRISLHVLRDGERLTIPIRLSRRPTPRTTFY